MGLKGRIERLETILEAKQRALSRERSLEQTAQRPQRVVDAVCDTYTWVTEHTQTYNEHWIAEGRPSPYEPFPRLPYFQPILELLEYERIVWIEKSRDMMISWLCVAYLTLKAMTMLECGVLFQTQKESKAIQLVALTQAVNCIGCSHCHYATAPKDAIRVHQCAETPANAGLRSPGQHPRLRTRSPHTTGTGRLRGL